MRYSNRFGHIQAIQEDISRMIKANKKDFLCCLSLFVLFRRVDYKWFCNDLSDLSKKELLLIKSLFEQCWMKFDLEIDREDVRRALELV